MRFPDAFYGGIGWSPAYEQAALDGSLALDLPDAVLEAQRDAQDAQDDA